MRNLAYKPGVVKWIAAGAIVCVGTVRAWGIEADDVLGQKSTNVVDEALIQKGLEKQKEGEKKKLEALRARMSPDMRERSVFVEATKEWDGMRCRKELAAVLARRQEVELAVTSIPQKRLEARVAAMRKDPVIKALEDEIREKQELLKKKMAELDALKALAEEQAALQKEQQLIDWKRQMLYHRLAKLGEKPPFPGLDVAEVESKDAKDKEGKGKKTDLHVVN